MYVMVYSYVLIQIQSTT